MASPYPRALPHTGIAQRREDGGGLGIVNEHDIMVEPVSEQIGVVLRLLLVDVGGSLVPRHLGTLEAVVHELRDREERVRALDHLPRGLDPEVVHQADLGQQELGHPAAIGGRVDMQHPSAGERHRGRAEALDRIVAGDLTVLVEAPRWDWDRRKHADDSYPTRTARKPRVCSIPSGADPTGGFDDLSGRSVRSTRWELAPPCRSARGRTRCLRSPCRPRTSPCSAPGPPHQLRRRAPSRARRRR